LEHIFFFKQLLGKNESPSGISFVGAGISKAEVPETTQRNRPRIIFGEQILGPQVSGLSMFKIRF
jgi:hypothetical protein